MVTLVGYILFLGVWPEDLPLIIPANVTTSNATDSWSEPGIPDCWLIVYSVSFGIACLYLITNVRLSLQTFPYIKTKKLLSFKIVCFLRQLSGPGLSHALCLF